MKTKLTLISLFLAIAVGNVMAQDADQVYTDVMNAIFQKINKSKITTGLLIDYGVQAVDPEAFNGIPADSNYVSMDTWKMLYGGLYTSKINTNANLTLPETVFAAIDNTSPSGSAVPLAMMHFQYNKLNDNAVSLGLLQVVNNQIVEVSGAASPYLTRQLFAVAPQSLYFSTPTASFVFKQSLWFSNSGKTVQKLEINFNNESGYKTAAWDAAVSYTFSSKEQKTIYFRLTYTDGSSHTSRTNVCVEGSTFRSDGSYGVINEVPIAASSLHSGGKMQIAYSSSNSSGQLRKPLIIAEGFDIYGIMQGADNTDIHSFLTSRDYGTINLNYSGGNLKDKIDLSQYDLVYVDYNNGTDDIRRNAKLFEEAIDWVNAHKTGGQPNVVMGLSMGGLVARYALRKMELAGKDHQVWKSISVDAPHKGANVPVSVQAMVRHLQDLDLKVFFVKVWSAAGAFNDLKGAINLLNSKAAKQMLIYQVTKNLSYDNSEYTAFMQEYDALGLPQQCQNIAIADGNGQGSKTFAPESRLITMSETYTLKGWMEALNAIFGGLSALSLITNYPQLAINIIPGTTQLNATVFANALPDKKNSKIYEGRIFIKKKLLFLIPVNVDITKKSLNSASDMLPIDGAPGGLYNITAMMGLPNNMTQYIVQPQFCFVPTVSALGLSNWKDKLSANLQNEDFYASGTSDFDQYFTSSSNELHTRLNSSAPFLYTHLTCPVFYFNPNVSSFCGTSSSIVKNPSNYALTWSVSSGFLIKSSTNTSASITSPLNTQTGILTCKNNSATVRKKLYSTCNYNPTISGPSSVCPGSSGTFTAQGFPSTVTWTCTGGLNLSVNGNTATVTNSLPLNASSSSANISSQNNDVLVASFNSPSDSFDNMLKTPSITIPYAYPTVRIRAEIPGTSIAVEKEFTTNSLYISDFNLPATASSTGGAIILYGSIQTSVPNNNISSISWSVTPNTYASIWANGQEGYQLNISKNGTYTVKATTNNTCGSYSLSKNITVTGITCTNCQLPIQLSLQLPNESESDSLDVSVGGSSSTFVSVYPNPASAQVTIDMTNDTKGDLTSALSLPSTTIRTTEPVYTVRIVDVYGSVVYTGEKLGKVFDVSVSSFPNGIYNIIVSDGVTTQQKKLMVKH
ncbi:MAG: hypothetical protein FWF52_05685 [Candidatus Azobacteroides sp.]|nr:hypothetical protein [Candidatus Azobacteroides sp.]